MYVVRDLEGGERVIKRLSKYEKKILIRLFIDLTRNKRRLIPLVVLKAQLKIKQASLSRIIKTLEKKTLIITYSHDLTLMGSDGKYIKYISLSPEGKQVCDTLIPIT